jgi:hypothetical protein
MILRQRTDRQHAEHSTLRHALGLLGLEESLLERLCKHKQGIVNRSVLDPEHLGGFGTIGDVYFLLELGADAGGPFGDVGQLGVVLVEELWGQPIFTALCAPRPLRHASLGWFMWRTKRQIRVLQREQSTIQADTSREKNQKRTTT